MKTKNITFFITFGICVSINASLNHYQTLQNNFAPVVSELKSRCQNTQNQSINKDQSLSRHESRIEKITKKISSGLIAFISQKKKTTKKMKYKNGKIKWKKKEQKKLVVLVKRYQHITTEFETGKRIFNFMREEITQLKQKDLHQTNGELLAGYDKMFYKQQCIIDKNLKILNGMLKNDKKNDEFDPILKNTNLDIMSLECALESWLENMRINNIT